MGFCHQGPRPFSNHAFLIMTKKVNLLALKLPRPCILVTLGEVTGARALMIAMLVSSRNALLDIRLDGQTCLLSEYHLIPLC